MPLARTRHLWLLLAPAALLAGLWWQRAPSSAEDGGSEAVRVSAAVPAAAASRGSGTREAQASPAVGPGLALGPRGGFEAQPDLYRYAQQLSADAAAGDPEATWMLSRVYDYCAGYALSPAGYAADSQWIAGQASPAVATMAAARDRVGRRCAGFAPTDGLTAQAVLRQRDRAARAGSLAAEAALLALGQPLDASPAYRRDLVERVMASRDPEAYLALSPAMGARASGDDALQGYVAGDQFAELAWQLAACRLGLACGAQSALMTSYCANGGICSQDDSQDFVSFVFDAAVPRQGAGKMDEMVKTLVNGSGVQS